MEASRIVWEVSALHVGVIKLLAVWISQYSHVLLSDVHAHAGTSAFPLGPFSGLLCYKMLALWKFGSIPDLLKSDSVSPQYLPKMSSFSAKRSSSKDPNAGYNQQLAIKPRRVGPPRLDPYQRLLSRFYEPFFFSIADTWQTRGRHATDSLNLDPEQARRRNFLRNLSYVCGFKRGGSSCTTIGLKDSETCLQILGCFQPSQR